MTYRDILEKIRLAFPQPVSDPIHDSYFVHSIMRALDPVDALKTHLPILGSIVHGNFEAARQTTLPDTLSSVEDVTADLVSYLRGTTIFWHPRTQQNVIPPTDDSKFDWRADRLALQPQYRWDEYSRLVALAEVEAVGMIAQMVGYNSEKASGVFTFGGRCRDGCCQSLRSQGKSWFRSNRIKIRHQINYA